MRIGRICRSAKLLLAALLLPPTLAGCASLAGSPPRVIGVTDSMAMVRQYSVAKALRAFDDDPQKDGDLRHGLTPAQYRNMVVAVYLNAADAQYHEWRAQVSDERRELGVGFDSMVIGLTGAASVARQSLVRSLSAAASIMAGTRGAIDRNVYFDRALPALLATMDAQRLRIRAEINRRLTDTATDYPLAAAFADISEYELAASLDRAIEDVTAQAAADRQAAQEEYNTAIHACHSDENLRTNRSKIVVWVRNDARTLEQLQQLAQLMGLASSNNIADLRTAIHGAVLAGYCSNAALENLMATARARNWGAGL